MALPTSSFDPSNLQTTLPTSPLPPNNPAMAQPPSNDDIEAVIQAATSAPHQSYPAVRPPRDTRTQLFVGNLPYRVRWQDLKDLFRRAGTVLRADVSLAPDNRSRGYGTVLLATAEDAGRAIDMFNGFVWQTRTLEVRHDKLGVSASGEEYLSPGGNFGQGVGGIGSPSGSTAGTPFSPVPGLLSRLPSTNVSLRSPYSSTADDLPGINTNLTSHLLAGKLSSPTASSPLLGSGSVPSPLGVHSPLLSQLTGGHNAPSMLSQQNTGVGAGGERSRNLFVGNLPFHIQWQDLKDLFRQAGTILRADVALGPDGRSRGFGTVSFATEMDAERAVRMFNGYEFNGRQLKVHFDKFAAPSLTALPVVHSLSAPQSPHPHAGGFHNLHHPSPLNQGLNLAQQLLIQQTQARQQKDRFGPFSEHLDTPPPYGLQRSLTDVQDTFRFLQSSGEPSSSSASDVQGSGPMGALTRAKSDTVQQLLQSQYSQSRLRPSSPPRTVSEHYPPQRQEEPPLHISLPAHRPPYAFDFSPGIPYDPYQTGTSYVGDFERSESHSHADTNTSGSTFAFIGGTTGIAQPSAEYMQTGASRPSTSPSPSPAVESQKRTHSHSQSESHPSLGQSTPLPQSSSRQQVTSPTITSPTSTHSSSLHTHPAHPGPISLPPPPPVTAFPIPPPHTLSPAYHPQMSPYGPPIYHPAMMMTPHGLPPITPSMPSFTFLPQPSPGGPSSTIGEMSSTNLARRSSPTNGASEPQSQPPGNYLAHLHHAHGGMLSPYTPFSPGVAMSPGAYWGGPGSNPYINPAVGAPVHMGYFPPVPPRTDESYFPPVAPSTSTSRPSGLANEIQPDSSSVGAGSAEETAHGASSNTSPDSVLTLEGTSGTEVSPRPPTSSSGATSWQAESGTASPTRDLAKEMEAMGIQHEAVAKGRDALPQQRPQSTGAHGTSGSSMEAAPLVRAESDPVQAGGVDPGAMQGSASFVHTPSRLSVGVKGKADA